MKRQHSRWLSRQFPSVKIIGLTTGEEAGPDCRGFRGSNRNPSEWTHACLKVLPLAFRTPSPYYRLELHPPALAAPPLSHHTPSLLGIRGKCEDENGANHGPGQHTFRLDGALASLLFDHAGKDRRDQRRREGKVNT